MRIKGEWMRGLGAVLCILCSVFFVSCNPDAHWVTENVEIKMSPRTISAGFVEYEFTTTQDAYYFIDCQPVQEGKTPYEHPKQFMTLALDSANVQYIEWRNWLLKQGEFNIAPFASHMLQYGTANHFFTNLKPDTEYWVYAFVVNPQTLTPAGKLFIETIKTAPKSVVDVTFEYRVRGYWDYIYPLNTKDGKINNHFPYFAATIDSVSLAEKWQETPEKYFKDLFEAYAAVNVSLLIRYGVQVVFNDGVSSDELFKEGHTYYTAIVGYDGFMGNSVMYKFTWTGPDLEIYFRHEDSIISDGQNE